MNIIDTKIDELRGYTSNFPFIEYYSHTHDQMYKILNEYTPYREEKIVLCSVAEGFEKALDLANAVISKKKREFKAAATKQD